YVARLLTLMKQRWQAVVTPRRPTGPMAMTPFIEMTSGYFERSRALLPQQGDRAPWRLEQHYRKDSVLFTGPVDDPALEFGRVIEPAVTA
ncbi:MAG: FAD-containing monooxygenase EthA, partial [Mycobacteriales bacterium]